MGFGMYGFSNPSMSGSSSSDIDSSDIVGLGIITPESCDSQISDSQVSDPQISNSHVSNSQASNSQVGIVPDRHTKPNVLDVSTEPVSYPCSWNLFALICSQSLTLPFFLWQNSTFGITAAFQMKYETREASEILPKFYATETQLLYCCFTHLTLYTVPKSTCVMTPTVCFANCMSLHESIGMEMTLKMILNKQRKRSGKRYCRYGKWTLQCSRMFLSSWLVC